LQQETSDGLAARELAELADKPEREPLPQVSICAWR